MKKTISIVAAIVALTSCNFVSYNGKAQTYKPSGEIETRSMDLKDFQKITVKGHADVTFVQADSFAVDVTTHTDAFEYLDYYVEDNTLFLKIKDNTQLRSSKLAVNVQAPVLAAVKVTGAADVDVKEYSSTQKMDVEVNGAGDLDFANIQVPALTVVVNGAGDVNVKDMDVADFSLTVNGAGDAVLTGKTVNASVEVNGAGDINARGLKYENIYKSKKGAGSIKI